MKDPILAAAFITVLSDGAWNDSGTVNSLVQQHLTENNSDALDNYSDDLSISRALRQTRTWLIREGLMEFDSTAGDIRLVDVSDAAAAVGALIEETAADNAPEPALLPSGKQAFYDITVNGVSEDEIWGYAPTTCMDRLSMTITDGDVHVAEIMQMLPMTSFTRRYSDHRSRIWVPEGRGAEARGLIEAWAAANAVEITHPRLDTSISFRNVAQIPTDLVGGLVKQAVDVVMRTPRGFAMAKSLGTTEDGRLSDYIDDVRSAFTLYAYDLLDRFDDARGVTGKTNFTAFLYGKASSWATDLLRQRYGRDAVEARKLITQASDALIARGEDPTQAKISNYIDGGDGSFAPRMLALKTLWDIRDAHSYCTDDSSTEILDIPGNEDVFDYGTAHELSRAVAGACITYGKDNKPRTDGVAFISTYLSTWGGMTKKDIAGTLTMREHTVSAAIGRVTNKIKDNDVLLDALS